MFYYGMIDNLFYIGSCIVLIKCRLNELENTPQFKKHQKKFGTSIRSSKRNDEENVSNE